ncbi:MAG TPA: type VI secretion system tip protein TssI/VgrG, partial [Polyangiaceae bacterium]|nr:type VI secretion system tip protein TssI/VgrG [Polyangiaceae bacterium]
MDERMIELVIEGVEARFEATSCRVDESIGKPFRGSLRGMAFVQGAPTGLESLDVIGKKATLTLRTHDGERTFVGLVDRVEDRESFSRVTIVSRIGWLADTRDYRVFVGETAKTIVDTVLGDHGISVDWLAQRNPPERAQCIQGFESDLDFVTRVLAEEGMCWYPGGERVVCVSDVEGRFVDLALTLPYREEAGLEVHRSVFAANLGESVASTHAVLRDYDFTHPLLDLQGESGDGALEWYEFPGGFVSPGAGNELAAMRLAERRNEQRVLESSAIALELQAGGVFSLEESPVEAQNGSWLVIGVTHRLRLAGREGSLNYAASFRAVPASRGYRPSRPATRPRLGVTTGQVTGASNNELMHDEHGRIRALLRWERRLPADETASTDLRVMQPQLSGGIFNPRVGWEQLLSHADPRGEIPVTLGRIYNGAQRPPATLPGGKVETHVGTLTTPKGSGGNFTKFDDTAGKEKLLRHASRDFNEKTGKDKKRKVGASEKRKVGGERRASIKKVRNERVDGHHGITIAGLRDLHVTSNLQLTAASENIGILG